MQAAPVLSFTVRNSRPPATKTGFTASLQCKLDAGGAPLYHSQYVTADCPPPKPVLPRVCNANSQQAAPRSIFQKPFSAACYCTNSSSPERAITISPESSRRRIVETIFCCASSTSFKRTGPINSISSLSILAARLDILRKILS